jgi:hypothetical protein
MKKIAMLSLAVLTAGAAFAGISGTIDADYIRTEGKNIRVTYDGNETHLVVGVMIFELNSENINGGSLQLADTFTESGKTRFKVFCVDIVQNVFGGDHVYDAIDPELVPNHTRPGMGATRAATLASFWAKWGNLGLNGTNVQKAAFQLAVWEIVYEDPANPYNVRGDAGAARGTLFARDGDDENVQQLANDWLNNFDPNASTLLAGMRHTGDPSTHQDFVAAVVPVPAAVLLGALGLGLIRRAKRSLA